MVFLKLQNVRVLHLRILGDTRRLVGLHLRADEEKPQNFRLFGADRCIIVIVLEKGLFGAIILAFGYGSNSVSLFFLHCSNLCVNFVISIEGVLVDVFWTPMTWAIVVLRTLMFYGRISCWYALYTCKFRGNMCVAPRLFLSERVTWYLVGY